MRKRIIAAAALALALATSLQPAHATALTYTQGPGGQFVGYTVPAFAIRTGDSLTFLNGDAAFHDVIAGSHSVPTYGPDQPWCSAVAGFPAGKCPLIWTPLIGLAQQAPVYGLESLHPGDQISFTCSIHAGMNGTLVVLPA